MTETNVNYRKVATRRLIDTHRDEFGAILADLKAQRKRSRYVAARAGRVLATLILFMMCDIPVALVFWAAKPSQGFLKAFTIASLFWLVCLSIYVVGGSLILFCKWLFNQPLH